MANPATQTVIITGASSGIGFALASAYLQRGANVVGNAVAPGIVDTPLYTAEMHGFLATLQPAGRIGTVQEIAQAVLYLGDAPFTTGVVLPVDGGMSAGKW